MNQEAVEQTEENPDRNRDKNGWFLPGNNIGYRGGRPKGVKHKLSQAFLLDVAKSWQELGGDVLQRVARDDPSTYLRVVASLVPKELIARMEVPGAPEIRDITPQDLAVVSKLRAALADETIIEVDQGSD